MPSDEEDEERDALVQENFVRVELYRFNLLGGMEACHVIDKYTYPKSQDAFTKALKENERYVRALGGDLAGDMERKPGLFDKAADYCQRVAAKVVVPGCKACNLAMVRTGTHADIVYRCFPPSSQLSFPELEDSLTRTGRVISKGVAVKKLIQQVALFFRPEADGWHAREDSEIMPLACLWRCIANLCMWGKSGQARLRLVAVFYASMLIYERLILKDTILFTDWHVHVFRIHYMQTYRPGTFFGMEQREAALSYNATLKAGAVWCELTDKYLQEASDALDAYYRDRVSLSQIFRFKDVITSQVHSEKALFTQLSKRSGVSAGVECIMAFYMFNFKDPRSQLLYTRGKLFIKNVSPQVSKALKEAPPSPSAELSSLSLSGG